MVREVDIVRLETGAQGTFGALRVDGCAYCVTLEPQDRGNRLGESCIPAGRYVCRRVASPRFGDTFEVTGVPGRSHILFHAGNVQGDTRGCVLLGRKFGVLRGDRAILNSGDTFHGFLGQCAETDVFNLTITDVVGGAR